MAWFQPVRLGLQQFGLVSMSSPAFARAVTNIIGIPGTLGFGRGIAPSLPADMTYLGSTDVTDPNYGNYQHTYGGAMVYRPRAYYRIGHVDNPTYATYGANSVDIKGVDAYPTTAAANAAGYALHRAFIDGGVEKAGYFTMKYKASKVAKGSGFIASSVQNGLPISTAAVHNPISDLTACATDNYYQALDAAKGITGTDGAFDASSPFFCESMFIKAWEAILSLAHGQAAISTDACAWFDATYNFPKGCNNNALGDVNDVAVKWESDGYSNCGKTGSAGFGGGVGNVFAKSTVTGQDGCVADRNGLMWEVATGLTRDSSNTNFYALKDSVAISSITSGSGGAADHWGTAAQLATNFDVLTAPHINDTTGWAKYGNGTNAVLSAATSGSGWLLTGLGFPVDGNGQSASGTNLFGTDGLYEYSRADLCPISGGYWGTSTIAGVWARTLATLRANSDNYVGFRCACYLD